MSIPNAPPLTFRLGRLARLARKELTEILRDRRTIVTLVVMPLLLYPLVMLAFRIFSAADSQPQLVFRIGFRTQEEQDGLLDFLNQGAAALRQQEYTPKWAPRTSEDLEDEVRQGSLDVALVPREGMRLAVDPRRELAFDCDLIYREDSTYGREAVAQIEKLCTAANASFLSFRLARRGLEQRPDPVRIVAAPVQVPSRRSVSLAVFVPLVLILMTMTGAVYPAIDLTAGERERGTLEVLVAAPLPRMSILFGKYVAVVCVAVLTAVVNLTAMLVSVLLTGLSHRLFGPAGISVLVMAQVLALVILFAAFFSAALLVVTSFARSFKEAQAYLIPMMLVSLVPGILGLMPGLPLASPLALVPLLNIVLLARDLLEGQAEVLWAFVVVASTALYAVLALFVAARLFGAEAVLYTQSSGWGGLFRRGEARTPEIGG